MFSKRSFGFYIARLHTNTPMSVMKRLGWDTLVEAMGEDPISLQIRVVANLCKYKYKNIFFKDRQ